MPLVHSGKSCKERLLRCPFPVALPAWEDRNLCNRGNINMSLTACTAARSCMTYLPPTIPTVIFFDRSFINVIISGVTSPRGIVRVPSTSNKARIRGFSGVIVAATSLWGETPTPISNGGGERQCYGTGSSRYDVCKALGQAGASRQTFRRNHAPILPVVYWSAQVTLPERVGRSEGEIETGARLQETPHHDKVNGQCSSE